MTPDKKRLLRAKISLVLLDELGRRPTEAEVERYTRAACVLYKVVLGLHFERKTRKQKGQLAIF
jgi:hypothetical protein